jgi:hypothetical protein
VRRRVARRRRGRAGMKGSVYPDGKLGVREEVVELRGDEGREWGRRGGGGRPGGVGRRRHRRRRMWLAMNSRCLSLLDSHQFFYYLSSLDLSWV